VIQNFDVNSELSRLSISLLPSCAAVLHEKRELITGGEGTLNSGK
jgi:hypothetical protein